jgi:N4-gp56 family major capsid protein
MTDVLTLTTNAFNSADIPEYYNDVFLERAKMTMTYDVLFTEKDMPENSGKVVFFDRMTPRAVATTSLTEGVTPSAVSTSSTQVSAEVAEKGDWEKVSSLFELTTFDKGLKNRIEAHGQQAGETIDALLKAELYAGATVQLANSKAHASSIASTDTMSSLELRKAVKTLRRNKAITFDGGVFRGVLPLPATFDLRGETSSNAGAFVQANQYKTPDQIKSGEIGRLSGVEVYETNNEKTVTSYSNVYCSFIGGKEAAAMIKIGGKGTGMIMKEANSTDNPLNMYKTLAWKIPAFAAKTLNSSWVIDIQTYGS